MKRVTHLLIAGALFLVTGCATAPAGHPVQATAAPISPVPSPSRVAEPSPTVGGCSASIEIDDVAHGRTFHGEGFAPEVPLTMTLSNESGSTTYTSAEIPELKSDVRGVWELHWFAMRSEMGPNTLELSGGNCMASADFEVPADRFPEAVCEPAAATARTGSEAADAYAQAVLDDEPLGYWRFEEETGDPEDTVTGTSAGIEGSPHQGEPGFVLGSRSILLDDEGGDWSDWLNIQDLELAADFTIEAWYRFCGEYIYFQDAIVGQGGPGADINFLEWHTTVWTGLSDVARSSEPIGRAGWHHLAVTRTSGDLEIFEDGHSVGTGTYDGSYPIGAIGAGDSGTFGGWLDEVAIYDHALSAETIAARAAMGR